MECHSRLKPSIPVMRDNIMQIVTESSEIFIKHDGCKKLSPEELQGMGRVMSGLMTGFQKGMGKKQDT